ncbi:Trypsin-like peptidase domain-containing protein [Ralstonia sp. 25mfcol4.1]|uniref:S1 family peptidase n=1 Tax=Ralstonia sp. 25mfcol4.1 TaxID=1761899 RepID=UPI00088CA890|nr:serine protease [Ralstonia sp. 25mfcol4.1]SDP74161.1 Trypsin-like peptidase domain-containing protein [Ralstonia sp. 25mfcol4.1]
MRNTAPRVTTGLLALYALLPSSAFALDSAQMLAKISPSVYAVATFGPQRAPLSTGSAVVIGAGQLVTACHVLAGARTVSIQRDNVSYGATLEAPDVERDICLLKVANFNAPAVTVAIGAPAFAQRVFAAVATESGQVSLSQGAIAGLRASADGGLDRIQASIAPSAQISGGGMFDDSGRLIGVLTRPAAGDTLTSALPAAWIASASARGTRALAGYTPGPAPAAVTAATPAPAAAPTANASPRVGETWRYQLTDRLTGVKRDVVYRVDRIDGDKVTFNQGARVESRDGQLQNLATPLGGEFDSLSPPAGWVPANVKPGMTWKYSYNAPGSGARMELQGRVTGPSAVRLPMGEFQALRISYEGLQLRSFYGAAAVGSLISVPYKIVVWYVPDLQRVVKFDATFIHKFDRLDESLTLVEHRFD